MESKIVVTNKFTEVNAQDNFNKRFVQIVLHLENGKRTND